MSQKVRAFAAEPEDLSSVPGSQCGRSAPTPEYCPLTSTYVMWKCAHTLVHTHNAHSP